MLQLKRNRALREKLGTYFSTGQTAIDTFLSGMTHFVGHGHVGLDEYARPSHRQESACDAIRFGIEQDLFEKSLMPALREDIMLLLEQVDHVINQCEDVLRQIHIQRVVMPEFLRDRLLELARLCHEAGAVLLKQGAASLEHDSHAKEHRDRIDTLESEADHLEQGMIADLFRSDLSLAEKMLVRDIISEVSHVADLAEDAANFIVVFRLKREI
jgi:predicted phosphate transport protein (TIGR00153 family)